MVLKAFVMYRGALAQYLVTQEHEGIFNAHLARYDGKVDCLPPYKLTLIRGSYKWTGDSEDPVLIEALGKVIEKKIGDFQPVMPAKEQQPQDGKHKS